MSYTPFDWKNLPDKTTPITAERLNALEGGLASSSEDVEALEGRVDGLTAADVGAIPATPLPVGKGKVVRGVTQSGGFFDWSVDSVANNPDAIAQYSSSRRLSSNYPSESSPSNVVNIEYMLRKVPKLENEEDPELEFPHVLKQVNDGQGLSYWEKDIVPAPPASGTFTLQSVDGVTSWVASP